MRLEGEQDPPRKVTLIARFKPVSRSCREITLVAVAQGRVLPPQTRRYKSYSEISIIVLEILLDIMKNYY